MEFIKKKGSGILLCLGIAIPSWILGKLFPIIGGAAIGLNSNVIKLVKTGGKPIAVGALCWLGIAIVSLLMQHVMHIW